MRKSLEACTLPRTALPPLNGLRAFEAAGRNLSFTVAARELNVTQSAVSHQIRALEARMGLPLFRRLNGSALVLTDAGQLLLPVVRDAFDTLRIGVERVIQREASAGTLTISVSPAFAARWLIPRLGSFRARHPELDLRISASTIETDFTREADVDAAIRHGQGEWHGLRADCFIEDEVFPVCAPSLLDGPDPPTTPEALLRHHVLLEDARHDYWARWLDAVGCRNLVAARRRDRLSGGGSLVFDDIALVLQAAIEGQGVGMGRSSLVAEDLAAGRLVQPLPPVVPGRYGYYFVCPHAQAERAKIAKLREWLFTESGTELRRQGIQSAA
jgi:LysR family glycine cleavage system transcriptional activator